MIVLICIAIVITKYFFKKKIQLVVENNHTDELTGLKNYKAIPDYLMQKIVDAQMKKEPLSIILFDIDNFKKIQHRAWI